MTEPQAKTRLTRNVIGAPGIVFLVLAAVAPLTAMTAVAPLGIVFGDGAGIPGAFVVAAVILLLFAVGYAQMSRHIVNAGAFYAYATRALGRPAGGAAAMIAVISYNAFVAGAFGTSGYFTGQILASVLHVHAGWLVWAAVSAALVAFLGYRAVDVSAKVLGVSLVLESLILLVLDVAIIVDNGLDFHAFAPSEVFSGSVGVGFLFVFLCFVGFEATALFGEEARDPKRTVPRATYASILLIGGFYCLTTLAMISAYGTDTAQEVAAQDPGAFVFGISQDHLGTFLTDVMQLLLVVSMFAALLAFHNSAARYLYALGRARLLPERLEHTHPRTGSPYVASLSQMASNVVIVGVFALAGADPYLVLSASMTGFATLGIIVLQATAAVSVVVFFRRRRDPDLWRTAIAPGLGAAGLIAVCAIAIANFSSLTGSTSEIINHLPWVLVVAAIVGVAAVLRMRAVHPAAYAALGHTTRAQEEDEAMAEPTVAGAGVNA